MGFQGFELEEGPSRAGVPSKRGPRPQRGHRRWAGGRLWRVFYVPGQPEERAADHWKLDTLQLLYPLKINSFYFDTFCYRQFNMAGVNRSADFCLKAAKQIPSCGKLDYRSTVTFDSLAACLICDVMG